MLMLETPPAVIAEPAWASRPSDAQIARLQQLYGWGAVATTARLTCYVRGDGRLDTCSSSTEAVRPQDAPWRDLVAQYRVDRTRTAAPQVSFALAFPRRFDSPPTVAMKPTAPQLEAVARSGHATVLCSVDAQGSPSSCEVEDAGASDAAAAAAALKAAGLYRFRPANLGGKPVDSFARWDVAFGGEVLSPKWLSKPSENDLARAYPAAAAASNLSGRAQIQCRVRSTGKLEACVLLDETPPGAGFGAAALQVSKKFLLSPQTRGGQSTDDGFITLPIAFQGGASVSDRGYGTLFAEGAKGHAMVRLLSWAPFLSAPTAEAVAAAFPARARAQHGYGRVDLRCAMTPAGILTDCLYIGADDPFDLARSALKLTEQFKVDLGAMTKAQLQDLYLTLTFNFDEAVTGASGDRRLHKVDWVVQPDATPPYPVKARADGVLSANAAVDCRVGAQGALQECVVAAETPVGYGFGTDALSLASAMRANLWTREGEPSVGGRIRVPFRFIDTGEGGATAPGGTPAPSTAVTR